MVAEAGVPVSVSVHAQERVQERFGKSADWLTDMIMGRKTVRIEGTALGFNNVRYISAHLLYVPEADTFCALVVDDRDRTIITVLTDEMVSAQKFWGRRITENLRNRARRRVLGRALPQGRAMSFEISLTGVDRDWGILPRRKLCAVRLRPEQINWHDAQVFLDDEQKAEVLHALDETLREARLRRYGLLSVKRHTQPFEFLERFDDLRSLEEAVDRKRWVEVEQAAEREQAAAALEVLMSVRIS